MLQQADDGVIIERVAALDIGKADVVCRVRVPAPVGGRGSESSSGGPQPGFGVRRW